MDVDRAARAARNAPAVDETSVRQTEDIDRLSPRQDDEFPCSQRDRPGSRGAVGVDELPPREQVDKSIGAQDGDVVAKDRQL